MSASSFSGAQSTDVEDRWEAYKSTIHDFYIVQNKKLQGHGGLMQEMKSLYNFKASKAQYERHLTKWGFKKNVSKHTWIHIAREVKTRTEVGKDSEVTIDGVAVHAKKLRKEIQRYSHDLQMKPNEVAQLPSALDVRVQTPKAVSIESALSTDAVSGFFDEWLEPTDLFNSWHPPLPILSFVSRFTTHGVGLRMVQAEPHLSENQSSLRGDVPSLYISSFEVTAQRQQYSDMLLRAALHGAGCRTMDNKNINQPDTLDAMLPAELIPCYANSTTTNDLISRESTECLIKVALFMVSNNLVNQNSESAALVLRWFEMQPDHSLIKLLISHNDVTSDALLENLFRYTILAENVAVLRMLPKSALLLDSSHPMFGNVKNPLRYACLRQNLELVRTVIDAGATTFGLSLSQVLESIYMDNLNRLPRKLGRIKVNLDMVRLLLEGGARICTCIEFKELTRSFYPESSVGWASYLDNAHLMELLLENKWNANPCSQCLAEAVDRVIGSSLDSRSILRLLFDFGAKVPLLTAIQCESIDMIKQLLEIGTSFSVHDLMTICGSRNMKFILDALDLYHRQNGNRESYWMDSPVPTPISGSPFSTAYQNSVRGQSTTSQCEADPTGHSTLGMLIINSVLALPEDRHGICLSECLNAAIEADSEPFIRALIQAGVIVNELHVVSAVRDKSQELISVLLDGLVGGVHSRSGQCFHHAIKRGDVVLVKQLLQFGLNIDELQDTLLDTATMSPLAAAILAGNSDISSCLLEYGASLNICENSGTRLTAMIITPLEAAVRARNRDLIHQLLQFGANPYDDGALLAAVSAGYETVHILVTACSQRLPYRNANFGCPALQLAVMLQNASMIRLLLGISISVSKNSQYSRRLNECEQLDFLRAGDTPMETALITDRGQDLNILKIILHALGDPNKLICSYPKKTSALLLAIKHSNHGAVDLLLSAGADANARADQGRIRTPLQAAVEQGNMNLVQKLLLLGVDVNSLPATYDGATALQLAARKGFVAVARLLLSMRADVNARGSPLYGKTALEEAAANGRIDMIHLLVHAGAQLQGLGNRQFEQAKDLATRNGYHAARKLLESLHAEQTASFSLNFGSNGMVFNEEWARAEDEGEQGTRQSCSSSTFSAGVGDGNIMTQNHLSMPTSVF